MITYVKIHKLNNEEDARSLRNSYMNLNPGTAFIEDPVKNFPGNFVAVYEGDCNVITLKQEAVFYEKIHP